MTEPGTARLLCDEMLAGFARMLRAAGHDTALAPPGTADAVLIELSRREGRVLLSRDRRLVRAAGAVARAVLLTGDQPDRDARQLARELGLDWTFAPFTRCMLDNTALRPATAEEIARMPARARDLPGPFRACPHCGRFYWPGSHARRITERLLSWRGLAAEAG
ncbi:Mut7-C RNAse domain-containing protein [Roseomonas marmotae]|uniref:Mut7-C RNAse domain-containing protein n=1 Tax=Roseomonas marmotae TaxID=2768161 RepID=A0ABS3K9H2_9PROT|nr:Mut7-C RNAse domain-containing protein [Roseomonas marmotae]MBO1073278.1 hypothetical protein [Roseomonas marmotae]QTI79103.1 hypothetical protein IAI58_15950 [Roseomonas marmotae]